MPWLARILAWFIDVVVLLVIARVLVDWLPVRWPPWSRPLLLTARRLTEPLIAPFRRVIPPIRLSSGMALDLSPTVLIIVLLILQRLMVRLLVY
ncbi:MAG: YggT family protein [Candidatus Geothermincolia bacterium]